MARGWLLNVLEIPSNSVNVSTIIWVSCEEGQTEWTTLPGLIDYIADWAEFSTGLSAKAILFTWKLTGANWLPPTTPQLHQDYFKKEVLKEPLLINKDGLSSTSTWISLKKQNKEKTKKYLLILILFQSEELARTESMIQKTGGSTLDYLKDRRLVHICSHIAGVWLLSYCT